MACPKLILAVPHTGCQQSGSDASAGGQGFLLPKLIITARKSGTVFWADCRIQIGVMLATSTKC